MFLHVGIVIISYIFNPDTARSILSLPVQKIVENVSVIWITRKWAHCHMSCKPDSNLVIMHLQFSGTIGTEDGLNIC